MGVVQIRKLLKRYIETGGEGMTLRSVMDRPYFVSDNIPLDELLSEMSSKKITLAVVRNSEKKLVGVLTVEDILEELVFDFSCLSIKNHEFALVSPSWWF